MELREHRPAADQRRPIPLERRRLDECVQVEVERKVEIDHERTARYDRKPVEYVTAAEPGRQPHCTKVRISSVA